MHISTSTYVICFITYLLGQAIHLFWIKIPNIKKRAIAANKKYIFAEFWMSDWNVIIGTNIFGVMLILGLGELLNIKPEIFEYIKWFFFFAGAFGSTVVMAKFSTYEKELINILDIKSNIADVFTGGTTTSKETLERGNQVTGKDVSKPNQ
jgi:hypothetical protein